MPEMLTPGGIYGLCRWERILVGQTLCENLHWNCPHCKSSNELSNSDIIYGGAQKRLLMRCPICDHSAVIRFTGTKNVRLSTEYAGPHVRDLKARKTPVHS